MDHFRLIFKVEVDQVGNGLAVETPVAMRLLYQAGRWQAQCDSPAISTPKMETLEGALVAGARQLAFELQSAVADSPGILGRIAPTEAPSGVF